MRSLRHFRLLPTGGLILSLVIGGCTTPALYKQERGTLFASTGSDAAIPSGMRRTSKGWEDTADWMISPDYQSRSISEWIRRQRESEPGWIRKIIFEIRTTPPLMIAVIQITAIAAIVHISRLHQYPPSDSDS